MAILVLLPLLLGAAAAAAAPAASAAAAHAVNVTRMREQLNAACANNACGRHSNTSAVIKNTTDCHGRLTAYEFGLSLIPLRAPQLEAFDALELEGCGVARPADTPMAPVKLNVSTGGTTVYVDAAKGSDDGGGGALGGEAAPFATIEKALAALRASPSGPRTMILRAGVHFLSETLQVTPADAGLTFSGYPTGEEEAWISGGELLPELTWSKVQGDLHGAYVAQLPASASPVTAGLQTLAPSGAPNTRVTRSRSPNGNPELCTDCWNGASPKLWHKDLSCIGKAEVVYKVSKNDDFCIKNEELCIKNDESCI